MPLLVAPDVLSRIKVIIDNLPTLTPQDLPDPQDSCPICLTSFSSLFLDTDPEAGVTKLTTCNHIFCRKDLSQWIQNLHGNCPTCRDIFLDIQFPSESDDESSDGGEYIPNERDEDFDDLDDDGFLDTDGFSDVVDSVVEGMEIDAGDGWEDESRYTDADMDDEDVSEWGLTDGESSNMSEDMDDAAIESEDRGAGAGTWSRHASELGISVSVQSEDESHDHSEVSNEAGLDDPK